MSQNSSCTATYLPSHKPSKSDKEDMLGTAGEVRMNSYLMSYRLPHLATPVLADQQRLTYINSVQTLDTVKKIYYVQWTVGTDGKKGLGNFVLSAWLDDDDDDSIYFLYLTIEESITQKWVNWVIWTFFVIVIWNILGIIWSKQGLCYHNSENVVTKELGNIYVCTCEFVIWLLFFIKKSFTEIQIYWWILSQLMTRHSKQHLGQK